MTTKNCQDEEMCTDSQEEPGTPSSSTSNKRLRIDREGGSVVWAAPTNSLHKFKSRANDYLEGSIVRIVLKNFVTYDKVEFRPGPNLNMIIGPNGTGKSTIVCAIALGLGWNTSLLGRAKEITDFIKHTTERAEIEIELKSNNRNVIITRTIAKNNKSGQNFKINGEKSSLREVQEKVKSLNIQVDNLCQFLPQDKVTEFAQLSSPELLVQTQKAIGERALIESHEKLIRLRTSEKDLLATIKSDHDHVEVLEKKNSILEKDVLRFKQREAILKKIKLYRMRIPFARYGLAKTQYDEAKQIRQIAHEEYQNLMDENEPVRIRKEQLEREEKEALSNKKHFTDAYTVHLGKVEECTNDLESLEAESDGVRDKIRLAKRQEKQRQQRISTLRADIADLEALVRQLPPERDTYHIQQRIEQSDQRLAHIREETTEIQMKEEEVLEEVRTAENERNRILDELKKVDDMKERRYEAIRQSDLPTYTALKWIKENQGLLKQPIFLPWTDLNIKDKKYLDVIESAISTRLIRTFVCQTEEDYKLITHEVIDRKNIRINVVCFNNKTMRDFRPPMGKEELLSYGFDCFLLDMIEAPQPVLVALCQQANLHEIPVASSDINHLRVEQSRKFRRYFSQDISYITKWSRYGKRLAQTSSLKVKQGKAFRDSIDIERKHRLERELRACNEAIIPKERLLTGYKERESRLREEYRIKKEEREQLAQEKREAQIALKTYERRKIQLDAKKADLNNELEKPNHMEEEEDYRQEFLAIAQRRFDLTRKLKQILEETSKIFSERNKASLKHMQVTAEIQALLRYTQDKDDIVVEARRKYNDADRRFNEIKEHAKRLLKEANEGIQSIDEETKQEFNELTQGMSLEELEDAVTREQTKADLQLTTNPQVIQQYNERQAEIDSVKQKLAVKESRLDKLSNEMKATRDVWEPKLDDLVSRISKRFSEAFDRIGCAGEVRIYKDEDYDKWGIEILVKFRDHETLNVLTAQRQSGGERSVSTIMYLMALQELAKTPFRVVDEINQGMDPRNERLVHSQMIQTACRPNTSQYFLITPKLLPDLEYHERMKVLCINNGEWLPEKLDVQHYIRNKLSQKSNS